MRLLVIVVALCLAALVGAVLVEHGGDPSTARVGSLTMVGDSLNVGTEAALRAALPGWTIATDDAVGRTSDEGIAALERIGGGLGPVVVVSLGTNDTQTDVEGFQEDVRAVLAHAGEGRCVIWATIWRHGANDAFNKVLEKEADANHALRLVRWDDLAEANPEWLAFDGVHPTQEGYAARAAAVARVARDCLPESSAT
jgi:lysophospholipase L1-like esterase